MRTSTCLVTARDYARYFDNHGAIVARAWTGVERRTAGERRSGRHDRRWEAMTSRRGRLADRRQR